MFFFILDYKKHLHILGPTQLDFNDFCSWGAWLFVCAPTQDAMANFLREKNYIYRNREDQPLTSFSVFLYVSWSRQIHETCLRSNGKLAVLRSVKFLSRSTLDLLYKLTVRSVIDYGLIIYYQTLKITKKARLDQLQYRAAKLCTGALHFTSQSKLEDDLAWESMADRAEFLGLCFFQKVHLGETRPLIRDCMSKLKSNLNSRSADIGCYQLF